MRVYRITDFRFLDLHVRYEDEATEQDLRADLVLAGHDPDNAIQYAIATAGFLQGARRRWRVRREPLPPVLKLPD